VDINLNTTLDRVLDVFRDSDDLSPEDASFVARKIASLRVPDTPAMAANEFSLEDAVYVLGLKLES